MYSGDPPPVFNLAVCESRTMINPQVARSLAGAAPRSFWLDQPDAPEPLPALAGRVTADLAVIGGGFTGLWTALLARERYPDLDVVLVEAKTVGWAASGRNGGFCSASLTHGIGNGLERFPDEMPLLERLGEQNLREIGETIAAATASTATSSRPASSPSRPRPGSSTGSTRRRSRPRQLGHDVEVLDAAGARAELNSPLWPGGLKYTTGNALVEPGRLAWGLRRACLDAGVRIYEHTPGRRRCRGPRRAAGMTLTTPYGSVRAGRVVARRGRARRVAAAPDRRVRDPGLGLRADDRAAVGRAAGQPRLAGPAAARPTWATSSTTSG